MANDLRTFLNQIKKTNDLKTIKKPVSLKYEIAAITEKFEDSNALLFENVEGYDVPILINIFGSHQRMAWALGVNNINEITDRVRGLLNLVSQGIPTINFVEKFVVLL